MLPWGSQNHKDYPEPSWIGKSERIKIYDPEVHWFPTRIHLFLFFLFCDTQKRFFFYITWHNISKIHTRTEEKFQIQLKCSVSTAEKIKCHREPKSYGLLYLNLKASIRNIIRQKSKRTVTILRWLYNSSGWAP